MSLYRKYRPQSFADVVGQEHVVTTLERAAESNKLAHAYLFAGGRGTGKTSIARILAKILMIQGITDETIQKQIIKGVEEGSIVDLLEIDAASNTGVENIRDLIEKIQFSPVAAAAKVYIIDEVHMLSKGAFNALLKTLEEPPAYAYFILATTELQKIPATIQSRCQCFPFRSIREEDIVRRLQYIADQERISVDREAVRAIAHHGGGALRDSISLLDQLRALPKITVEDVLERTGGVGQEEVETVMRAIAEKDTETILATVQRVEEAGTPLDTFLRQLLGAVRNSMHTAVEEGKPISAYLKTLDTLLHAIRDVRIAPVPGLVLESALLALCTGETIEAATEKEPKSEKKERGRKAAPIEAPVTTEAPPTQEEETTASATIEVPEVSLETLQDVWKRIVDETTPPSVKMSLKNGSLQRVEGDRITVGFRSSFHRDTVGNTEASRKVEEVIAKIFKKQLRLECVLEGASVKAEPTEQAVNLAEAAAEIF